MEEDPPPKPDDPAEPHTAAYPLRARGDSTYSTASSESIGSTRTLQSVDLTVVTENGRTYADEQYYMPCDAAEQDRLSILHRVYVAALGDRLTTTPINAATTRILDVGTGPGDWAVAISERFPYADVVGLDLTIWDVEATEAGQQQGQPAIGLERGVQWEIDDLDIWRAEEPEPDLHGAMASLKPFDAHESNHDSQITTASQAASTKTATTSSAAEDSTPPTSSEAHNPSLATSASKGKGRAQAPTSPTPSPNPLSDCQPKVHTLDPSAAPAGWNFSEPFDLIHIRGLKGVFASWPALYAEVYKNLAPGGWIEVVDYSFTPPSLPDILNFPPTSTPPTSPSTSNDHPIAFPSFHALFEATRIASLRAHKNLGTSHLSTALLTAAGFVDVRATQVNVPVGTWPKEARQKALGKLFVVCLMEGFEAVCLRLLTRYGGWDVGEVRRVVEEAKAEVMEGCMGDKAGEDEQGWVAPFRWVVGRKGRG